MAVNNSGYMQFGTELAATMNGSLVSIGTIPVAPVVIIFDNQGAAPVAIYVDGNSSPWRTFPAGEALTIDCRANHGIAENFTRTGIQFSGNGASGTFSISYLYAKAE